MSVLMADKTGLRDSDYEKHSKAPEGTATGAAGKSLSKAENKVLPDSFFEASGIQFSCR